MTDHEKISNNKCKANGYCLFIIYEYIRLDRLSAESHVCCLILRSSHECVKKVKTVCVLRISVENISSIKHGLSYLCLYSNLGDIIFGYFDMWIREIRQF